MGFAMELENYTPPDTMAEGIWQEIMLKVIHEWPDDYEMQLHTAENEVEIWLSNH